MSELGCYCNGMRIRIPSMWLRSTLRLSALICSSFALLGSLCPGTAEAKFASRPTRQVPIVRLLKNLELQRTECGLSTTDRALVEFKIGRLHAMAYALKTEQAATDAQAYPGSRFELPDFGNTPDHMQFQVSATKDPKKQASAITHLKLAIAHLEKSTAIDPEFLPACLGLAWCLDQSGQKDKALAVYRRVFKDAFAGERASSGGMYNWSIAGETAEYLRKLLDPAKDGKELADLKAKVGELEKLPRYITPVVIPLQDNLTGDQIMSVKPVSFDLDGLGKRRYSGWISPSSGWLVFDSEGTGKIDSGLQLIGSVSFWLFWRNGYEVLRALDDDRDGLLTGGELDKLAVWQDGNTNGLSEPGEVRSLAHWGIDAISTRGKHETSDRLISPKGMRMTSGNWRPTWDVTLYPVP